ncbi:MAG: hypothetical protein ABI563_00060 [Specibacter sp.]
MSQHQQPAVPPQPPERIATAEAYRQGYLQGHRAGWMDALAAQAKAAAPVLAPPIPTAPVPAAQATQVTAAKLPAPVMPGAQLPANAMPVLPAYGQRPAMPMAPPSSYPVPAPAPAQLDPAALAARRNKRESQNINITLYVASLLMVAAAALFVGSNLPAAARLVGVWAGTALFYGAGLLLHRRVGRLRPAAVAFTGTALAIIPFAGLATYNLGFPEAPGVWLATSVIGTVAYIVAAVRLQSRLVVYLSLAFLLSTAWSSVAVLGAALAWYFTALIIIAALLTLTGYLLKRRGYGEGSRPSLYAKPLNDLGPWFAPAGLVGSLIFSLALNAADHALVLVAGVIYYAVMTLTAQPVLRRYNYLGLRLSLTMAAPFLGWMIHPDPTWAAGAFTLVLAAQALPIAHTHERISTYLASPNWAKQDVYASMSVMAAASLVWSLGWHWTQAEAGGNTQLAAVGVGTALVVSMLAVPAFLPHGEWLPLPAAGAILMFAPFLEAAGWTVLLAIALVYAVLRHLTAEQSVLKHTMLVAARILVTALAASSLAAFVPDYPGKAHLIVTVIAVIAALQLLADTILAKYGAANPVTSYSAAAWALVGTALVVALSAAYGAGQFSASPDAAGLDTLRLEFVLAAVAVGMAAAAHSLTLLPRAQGWSGAEFIAPLYLVVAALSAGPVLAAGGASTAWAVSTAYLVGAGMLLRGRADTLHRWIYWWGARAMSMLLAVALFQLWAEADPRTEIAGTHVGLSLMLLLALVPHVLILAVAVRRGNIVAGLSVDVCITLFAVVVLGAGGAVAAQEARLASMVVVALVTAATGVLAVAGSLRREPTPAAVWAAPAAMVAMALWSVADRAVLAVVLTIVAAVSGVLAARAFGSLERAAHFLLARVAATALVAVVFRELTANLTVVSLAVTVALLGQVALQYAAIRVPRVHAAVGEPRVLRAGLWLVLAAQIVVPIAYHLWAGGFAAPGTALRWVVCLELLVLAVTSVVAQASLSQRGASYLALVAVMGGAAVIAPVLWTGATALILLAFAVAVIVWRCFQTPKTAEMRWYWLVSVAAFLATACIVDSDAATGIFAAMWLVAGLALIVGAHLMQRSRLTLPGALLVFLAAVLFRSQVLELSAHPGYSALAGLVVVAGTLYVVRLLLLEQLEDSRIHRGSIVGMALGGGAFFSLWSMFDAGTVLLGAVAFTVVAMLACVEVPAIRRRSTIDAAVVACAAVWFRACSAYVELGVFWAVLWCALALAALAVIRYAGKQPGAGRGLLVGAASFASFGAFLTIFSGDSLQQVISLLVFVALLSAGMVLDERIFTVWGAIGVATAVIWYLRGFTYILLALLALALIGFVIWRLNRRKPHDGGQPPVPAGAPGQPGRAGSPADFGVHGPPQADHTQQQVNAPGGLSTPGNPPATPR